MPQATYYQDPGDYDYTPAAAVAAGAVVVIGNVPMIAKVAIPADTQGALSTCGLFKVVKDSSVFAAGDPVYWQPAGDPVGGTADSGAASSTAGGGYLMGYVPPDGAALTGDETVQVVLGPDPVADTRTTVAAVAAAGSAQGDAASVTEGFTHVTAADATKGVKLPAAAAGKVVEIKNSDAANAILKIYPATGDAINALSANAAFSIAAKTSVRLIALDGTTWYSIPLLPS